MLRVKVFNTCLHAGFYEIKLLYLQIADKAVKTDKKHKQ
jgi:hypothetical protein